MRHERLLDRAAGVALTSTYRWQLGAVIARGGNILAVGANSFRNPPSIDHKNATVHAEIAALKKVRNTDGCTIYVARVNRLGTLRLARPCLACYTQLADAGIREIVYTMNDDHIGMERIYT